MSGRTGVLVTKLEQSYRLLNMLARTHLLYQGDTYLFSLTAKVLAFRPGVGGGKAVMILDRTIFYPQGGGQPSDVGTIKSAVQSEGETAPTAIMAVSMVRATPEGIVEHEGVIEGEASLFGEGAQVHLTVDSRLRLLHSRIHSAGHLLDHSAERMQLPLVVSKGYHFPAGPYVEYGIRAGATGCQIDTSPTGLQDLRQRWEEGAKQMIQENLAIHTTMEAPSQLAPETLAELSPKVREAGQVRLIYFEGCHLPRPCGGTHVANTKEIGLFTIRKISFKSSILRVCYAVA